MTQTRTDPHAALDRLVGVVDALRENCGWTARLTPERLAPYLVEEAAEVSETVAAGELGSAVAALGTLTTPWSARFSLHLLAALGAAKAPLVHVAQAMPHLLTGLHPDALGPLESWLARLRDDRQLATQLRNLLQFHSVKRSITEAFR